jgi:ATP-binding cassette, subfamily B, bacterial
MKAADTAGLLERARGTLRLGRALRLVWESSPLLTVASLGIALFQAGVPLAALYLLKLIIDEVTAGIGGDIAVVFRRVLFLIGLAALVTLLEVVLRTLSSLVFQAQSMVVTDHVYSMLHGKSVQLDLEHYEDPTYQDLLQRTQQEAPSRPPMVIRSLIGIARSGITLAGLMVLLATAHSLLIVLLFATALPGLAVRVRFARRTHRWMRRRAPTERLASYYNMLLTMPWIAKDIRMSELGPVFSARFREVRRQLRKEGLAIARNQGVADVLTQSLAALAILLAFAFIAQQTLAGVLTIGGLVMYLQAVQKGQSVFGELVGGVGGLYEHNLFLSHLDEFMALQPKLPVPPQPAAIRAPVRHGLDVDGVSFSYPGSDRLALSSATLRVDPGEMVAVVGANGSGKTTLMKLICRLYDPTAGRVLFDGRDIREYDPVELRRHIAILFQDFPTYAFAASDNIWLGDVRAPRDNARIAKAAELAGAARIFERFPLGLETPLGKLFDGGRDVSGGESQKLALARTFYRQSPLLILDEPSSALDAQAEIDLFNYIREQAAGRAVVVISHRFSTVRMADRIYVMENGTMIETGTHAELVRLGGTYARLFELQAAAYRGGDTDDAAQVAAPVPAPALMHTSGLVETFSPEQE